jgi:organic radical activating enzyme
MKDKINEFRNKLNFISPSFCVAKWKQVTIHLATGQTHSCHHPVAHKIPLNEIAVNVSALHNTSFKKQQQLAMIDGIRPAECDYCWKVEDTSLDVYSDRIMKSVDSWAINHIDSIVANPLGNHNPSYLEVSFSNTCNFKCSYCSPEASSKWTEEIKQHGAYPTSTNFNNLEWLKSQDKLPVSESEYNPYVEAFWEWWPTLYPSLEVLRITGGEPLLTKNTFKVLDYIIQNPRPNLELNINSNLGVPSKIFNQFIDKIKFIQENNLIKSFKLYTSAEAHGANAEYIRFGLNYQEWKENCNKFLKEVPNGKLTVMSTYNALSVTSYLDFLKDWIDLRSQHNKKNLSLDISYLRWPPHQNIFILDQSFIKYFDNQLSYIKSGEFFDHEIHRFERIYKLFENHVKNNQSKIQDQKDFAAFVIEHDKRRGTSFQNTFPEMNEFLQKCKQL